MNETLSRPFRAVAIVLWLLLLAGTFAMPRIMELTDADDFLVRNTARIFLGYWAVAIVLILRGDSSVRLLWTLAWSAFAIHVLTAFACAHHWSHANAFQHVEEASGFGPGIFVSYFFTLAWTIDVLWWWLAPNNRENRPRWLNYAWYGFMFFVVLNATVVFESGAIRWVGGGVLLGVVGIWVRFRGGRR